MAAGNHHSAAELWAQRPTFRFLIRRDLSYVPTILPTVGPKDDTLLDYSENLIELLCGVQGYLAHKKRPPPLEHQKALGAGVL